VATFRDILDVLGRPDSRRNHQALHAFVHSLRGKIALDPVGSPLIFNEARVGYRLAAEPGDPARLGGDDQGTEGDGCVSSSPSRFVAG
jgi:hypothetical protein